MIIMDTYYIYFHRNSITNEIFYVGKGTGYRATTKGGRGKYYLNYVKKHGKPIIEINEKNLSNEKAVELEKYYIKHFGRKDLKTGILVNCTDGGEGCFGLKHSDETKRKMSESKKGMQSFRKGMKNPYTKETLEKMSKSHLGIKKPKYKQRKDKGRTYDLETRIRMGNGKKKPILQFDKNNVFIKEWNSTTDAENELKINGIRNVLRGDSKTCGKFIWKHKNKT